MLHITKVPLFFVSLLVIAACFSCDNKQEPETELVINYIRFTDPSNIVSLSRAPVDSTIAFVGQGLEQIHAISFNGIEAVLNPVFVTSNSLIVTIPNDIPGVISHTILLYTTDGRIFRYSPFIVDLPLPVITSVSDPHAADSLEVTLYGAHFYSTPQGAPPAVSFSPNLDAQVLAATRDSLIVLVPLNTQQGVITVTTEYGQSASPFIFRPDTIL